MAMKNFQIYNLPGEQPYICMVYKKVNKISDGILLKSS
jgi:hypothetical protein